MTCLVWLLFCIWLLEKEDCFWVNCRAKLNKILAIPNYFRHSFRNFSGEPRRNWGLSSGNPLTGTCYLLCVFTGKSVYRSWKRNVLRIRTGHETGSDWSKAPVVHLCLYHSQGKGHAIEASLWRLVRELWFLEQRRLTFHFPYWLVWEERSETSSSPK